LAIRQLSPKEHAQLSGGTTNRFLRRGQRYGSFATFKSLSDAWADTTTPHGRLMLTVLGGLAEFERELIIARTGEGRTRAKARGVKFGRPAVLTPHQRREAMREGGLGNPHGGWPFGWRIPSGKHVRGTQVCACALVSAMQSQIENYRAKAKEFARLMIVAKSLRHSRQYRNLAEMYWALALGEERAQPSKTNVKRNAT
jgi:hypothetical protein